MGNGPSALGVPISITWCFSSEAITRSPCGPESIRTFRPWWSASAARANGTNGRACWSKKRRSRRRNKSVFQTPRPGGLPVNAPRNGASNSISSTSSGSLGAWANCFRVVLRRSNAPSPNTRARSTSGRVGRSAAAKELDADAVELAVRAHVRHVHTPYDRLLASGLWRSDARERVSGAVEKVLNRWRGERE